MYENNLIYTKAFKFAVKIINVYKLLCEDKKEYTLSKQLLKAGTSIGANVREGLEAQSKKDFISKLCIALKEAAECEYWIDLLSETDYIDKKLSQDIKKDLVEIIKILSAIVKTSRNRQNIE